MNQIERKVSGETISIEDAQPCVHRKRGGWITFPFIISGVLGLSLAAGGWGSNLIVFFMEEFNIKSIKATQINNIVLGCNNLFPIAGAIIADCFWGSFTVITIFAFISLLGSIIFTLSVTIPSLKPPPCHKAALMACESPTKLQFGVLYVALTLSSLGVGGTRFTIATMGADQFNKTNHQNTFFNWYFFALYIANIISFTAIIFIQDNVSWGLGFGICVIANAISLVVFLLGKVYYRKIESKRNPFISIVSILLAAVYKRKKSSDETLENEEYYQEINNEVSKIPPVTALAPSRSFRFLNRAALKTESDIGSWKICTVKEVEDLKKLIKIFPLWSTGFLLTTTIDMSSSFTILQALTMDRHVGPYFKIPAGSFLVFNLLATTISIFIIDRFLLSAWRNITRRSMTPLQRIGLGHVINVLAMVAFALVETRRLHIVWRHNLVGQQQPGSIVPMSSLWLVITLAILGIGEAFHFPGQVTLYYQEFPESLRSTSTAMISLLIGIGFYLGSAVTDLVHRYTKWLPDNINDGRLDNVYWMLTVIGVVNFGYYLVCAKMFKYQSVESQDRA